MLNKADLVQPSDIKRTIHEFSLEGKECVATSTMDKRTVDILYAKIFALLKENWIEIKKKAYLSLLE